MKNNKNPDRQAEKAKSLRKRKWKKEKNNKRDLTYLIYKDSDEK